MSTTGEIISIPELSGDSRVRVFRRTFIADTEFEGSGDMGTMEVDAYVIFTDRFVVVLDTLLCPEDMATIMQQVEPDVQGHQVFVVNSHADWDHVWGNNYFTGPHAAPILAHEYAITRLTSEEARTELAAYQRRDPLFQNVTLTLPTLTFSQQFTLHGGDLTVTLFAAPGHQPDHIAAWLPELRLLLAFDAIEWPIPLIGNAASVQPMHQTLEHFLSLHPARVLCSHTNGRTVTIELVRHNLTYLKEIERRCCHLLLKHRPTSIELEYASTLINYPFEEAIAAGIPHVALTSEKLPDAEAVPAERSFYEWAHDNNIQFTLQWLMREE
jgi:glyoxylase-like metal-dependent hydrolase (beta-lactamase superfamily II)